MLLMIYYFSHIVNDSDVMDERNAISSEAGRLRTNFIARAINRPVTIVSMGVPVKKGCFARKRKREDENINLVYLSAFNLFNLKYFYSVICLFVFGLTNFKRKDTIILYNSLPFHIFPIFLLKTIFKLNVILEIEELYSSYQFSISKQIIFNLSEHLGIAISDKYLVCNKSITEKLPSGKECLINAGYKSNNGLAINNSLQNNSKCPIVVYSGRLDYEGGVEVFLDSISFIKTHCKIIITGAGDLQAIIKNFINNNPMVEYEYLGFLNRFEYEVLLTVAKVCINPTRCLTSFGQYSFPSKVYQYLEFGNKVVSSQLTSIKEMNGSLQQFIYYYENDSSIALANTIDLCLANIVLKKDIIDTVNNVFINESCKINKFVTDIPPVSNCIFN